MSEGEAGGRRHLGRKVNLLLKDLDKLRISAQFTVAKIYARTNQGAYIPLFVYFHIYIL